MEKENLLKYLHSLNDVSIALMQCHSIEELVQKALAEVRRRLDVQVASIFLFSKEGVIKRIGIDGVDKYGNPIDNSWLNEFYKPGESFSGKAVPPSDAKSSFGEPQYSNNIFEEYPQMKYAIDYQEKLKELKCGASVPLNGLNKTFGTLEVLNKQEQEGFNPDDLYWLMLIGTSVADSISSLERQKYFQVSDSLLEKLISLEPNHKNFNLRNLYEFVAEQLIADFTPYKACIIRTVGNNEELNIEAKSCTKDINLERRVDGSIKTGSKIVGEVYQTRKPCFIENISYEINKFNNKKWIEQKKLESFACLPLLVKNKCVGTLSIYTGHKNKFYKDEKAFLENIAFLTAAITARFQIFQELRRVRKQLDEEREKFFNSSILVGYDSMLESFLHQYKNELIDGKLTLEKVSNKSNINQKEREQIISDRLRWLEKRIEELQAQFRVDSPVSIEINKLVKETVKLIALDDGDIEIEQNYNDKIPLVSLDEEKIKHIIRNLISNARIAIDKANRKKGKVSVSTGIVTSDRIQYIQIIIEDNGIGIPKEIQDKIFEQGFTTRKDEGGTGIGLYVSRLILDNYGSKIYHESSVGKGTKFFVNIPLRRYQN
ncbi:MAG: GAF domain-containing protein [Tatlockia sp.]|nr:GAF domain-containing protein [Tatlockia sp.]